MGFVCPSGPPGLTQKTVVPFPLTSGKTVPHRPVLSWSLPRLTTTRLSAIRSPPAAVTLTLRISSEYSPALTGSDALLSTGNATAWSPSIQLSAGY